MSATCDADSSAAPTRVSSFESLDLLAGNRDRGVCADRLRHRLSTMTSVSASEAPSKEAVMDNGVARLLQMRSDLSQGLGTSPLPMVGRPPLMPQVAATLQRIESMSSFR